MTRYTFKITLIGDGAVGKTSLRRRFMGQSFVANHLSTIGADFSAEKIFLDNGDEVEFQLWDLAGQPGFKSIRSRFYNGTRGSLCVFDLTNKVTLTHIPSWIDELFKNSGYGAIPIMLIGNKVDLEDQCEVNKEKVQHFLETLEEKVGRKISYFETSAKTGENVRKAFTQFAELLRDQSK